MSSKPTRKRNTARTNKMRTKLAQGIAQGMNVSEASRAAGYAHYQSAFKALKGMRLQMYQILERMDLPVEKVLRDVLAPGLYAQKSTEHGFEVDHEQRGKYFDRYFRIIGVIGNGHEEPGDEANSRPIVFNLAFLGPERATAILEAAREPAGSDDRGLVDVDAVRDENAR